MASRWQLRIVTSILRLDPLFSRFADRLSNSHAACELDPSYRIDTTEPLDDYAGSERSTPRHWISRDTLLAWLDQSRSELNPYAMEQFGAQPVVYGGVTPPSCRTVDQDRRASEIRPSMQWNPMENIELSGVTFNDGNLLSISQFLMGLNFTGMNRIVTFDDYDA